MKLRGFQQQTDSIAPCLLPGKYGYLGAWCQADSATECLAVRSLLHLRYADGQEEIVASHATNWKAREGPVRTDDYYCEFKKKPIF